MKRASPAGFSLLEVILAMAVFAGAIAVLGEVASIALRNAEYTKDMSRAQALCESTLDQIIAGYLPPDPVSGTPIESSDSEMDSGAAGWVYSIEQQAVDDETGLISLRVTVARDLPPEKRPVSFALSRWMADPSAMPTDADMTSTQDGSSGTSSTSTGGF